MNDNVDDFSELDQKVSDGYDDGWNFMEDLIKSSKIVDMKNRPIHTKEIVFPDGNDKVYNEAFDTGILDFITSTGLSFIDLFQIVKNRSIHSQK